MAESFYGGKTGQPFKIAKIFNNKVALDAAVNDLTILVGQFVLISYGVKNSDEYNNNLVIDNNVSYNNFLYQKSYRDNQFIWEFITDLTADSGPKGDTGSTYLPSVSSAGLLSWTLVENPTSTPGTINIKGQRGIQGETGKTYVPAIENDILSWTIAVDPTTIPASVNVRGPQGEPGAGLDIQPGILASIDNLPTNASEGTAYFVETGTVGKYNFYVYHDGAWTLIGEFTSVVIDDATPNNKTVYSSMKTEQLLTLKLNKDLMTWGTF